MFRRLIAVAALVGATFAVAPTAVNADTAGGVSSSTSTAMGSISAGNGFTCAVVNGGQVACWGRGNVGAIGDGNYIDRSYMTTVPGISTATQVSAGADHVCARLSDGSVKCWGRNQYGQLGNGNTDNQPAPVTVCNDAACATTLGSVTQVSAGSYHTCAVISDGSVKCWGRQDGNRIGNGGSGARSYPVVVASVTGATKVDAGPDHSCAIKSDKSMRCWGTDNRGSLGDASVNSTDENAVIMPASNSVAVFSSTTCAINDSDNLVRCWGSNTNGQHGVEGGGPGNLMYDSIDHASTASTAKYGSNITAAAVAGSDEAACALTLTGTVICWGALLLTGNSRTSASTMGASPFMIGDVTSVSGATAVTVGNDHVCVLLSSSTIKCWGDGTNGQLGKGDTSSSTSSAVAVTTPVWRTMTFAPLSNMTLASSDQPLSASASVLAMSTDFTLSPSSYGICSIESPNGLDYSLRAVAAGSCTVNAGSIGALSGSTYYANAPAVSQTITISAVAPTVTAGAATAVTPTAATISGTVHAARATTTTVFKYGTKSDLSDATSVAGPTISSASDVSTTKSISTSISGLKPGTTYYFTVAATNSTGTTTASTQTFTTIGLAPVVTTGTPTSVSSGRATLNGVVNPGGLDTTVFFTIGQKSDLSDGTRIDFRSMSDLTATDVSVSALNLVESVRYYFRVEATNSLGSSKGDIKSFTAARPTGISVNDAAEFTNKKSVTIFATGPSGSTQVIISNDGGFKSSETFSLTDNYAEIPWTLVASRDERLPKTVYARFVQRFGTQSANYSDDIILDTTAPEMNSASGSSTGSSSDNVSVQGIHVSAASGGVKLTVKAKDANSGIGKVQVKGSASGSPVDVTTGSPKATSRTVKVNTTKKKLWVRVVDRAGNVSKWVTVTVK